MDPTETCHDDDARKRREVEAYFATFKGWDGETLLTPAACRVLAYALQQHKFVNLAHLQKRKYAACLIAAHEPHSWKFNIKRQLEASERNTPTAPAYVLQNIAYGVLSKQDAYILAADSEGFLRMQFLYVFLTAW